MNLSFEGKKLQHGEAIDKGSEHYAKKNRKRQVSV